MKQHRAYECKSCGSRWTWDAKRKELTPTWTEKSEGCTGVMAAVADEPQPDTITLPRAIVQAAIDALKEFNLKEDQIVAGQAGYLILRMPLSAISQGSSTRDALEAALKEKP